MAQNSSRSYDLCYFCPVQSAHWHFDRGLRSLGHYVRCTSEAFGTLAGMNWDKCIVLVRSTPRGWKHHHIFLPKPPVASFLNRLKAFTILGRSAGSHIIFRTLKLTKKIVQIYEQPGGEPGGALGGRNDFMCNPPRKKNIEKACGHGRK